MIVNNGPRIGWQPSAWDTTNKIQGLESIWQVHLALDNDAAHNVDPDLIANLEATDQCKGKGSKRPWPATGNHGDQKPHECEQDL